MLAAFSMNYNFRNYHPKQPYLLPPALDDRLPQDDLARFNSKMLIRWTLTISSKSTEQTDREMPPNISAMMVKVLIYAYCVGVPSSTGIAYRSRSIRTHPYQCFWSTFSNFEYPEIDLSLICKKRETLVLFFRDLIGLCQRSSKRLLTSSVALICGKILDNVLHLALKMDWSDQKQKLNNNVVSLKVWGLRPQIPPLTMTMLVVDRS